MALMIPQPSMIKLPVLDVGGKLLVGFKFPSSTRRLSVSAVLMIANSALAVRKISLPLRTEITYKLLKSPAIV